VSRQVLDEWLQDTVKQTSDSLFLSRIVEDTLRREMHGEREMSSEVRDAVERLCHVLAHEI
jgi:hypothetical protein